MAVTGPYARPLHHRGSIIIGISLNNLRLFYGFAIIKIIQNLNRKMIRKIKIKGERRRIVPRCSPVQNTSLSSLTSRFGMDLGVPCSLWPPTKYNYEEDYLNFP